MRSVGEAAKTILKTRSTDDDEAPEEVVPVVQPVPDPFRSHKRRTKTSGIQKDVSLKPSGESADTSSTENTISPEERLPAEPGAGSEEQVSEHVADKMPAIHSSDTKDPDDTAPVSDLIAEEQEPITNIHNTPSQPEEDADHP
jgi:hypothetical protein